MSDSKLTLLKLSPQRSRRVKVRWTIAMAFLCIPILQIYSFLVALPLLLHPALTERGAYLGATFLYMYPTNWVTVAVFGIYYLIVFYLIEIVVPPIERIVVRFFSWLFTFK